MGGQGTEPYEQNTQQSPGLGESTTLQFEHSWNHWHESVGIVSVSLWPHSGQVSSDWVMISGIKILITRYIVIVYNL